MITNEYRSEINGNKELASNMTRVISRQSMRRARNHVEIEQENEAEEREKA